MPSNKKGTEKGKGQQQQLPSPPMTSSIALFCLIHGQPIKNAFPVQIEKTRTVGHLKEEILRKNLNAFHGVDAAMLILWKVHIEMKKDDINAVLDVPSTANDTAYELAPFEDIEQVFTDPKTKLFITPTPKHIHIVVQAPMQGLQRVPKRKLSVTNVPLQSTGVEFERLYDCWKWWQEVRKMKIEEGLITFTTKILGWKRYGSTIVVRDVYKDLYEKVTCKSSVTIDSTDIDSFIIIGTPGIGKSIFGFYLLCRYANEHPDADILWEDEYTMISLHRNGSITNTIHGEPSNMRSLDPSGHVDNTIKMIRPIGAKLWILDEAEPKGRAPNFVLLTPPKYSRYKKLEKAANVNVLGMPVWEFAELKRLWEIKFPSVDYEGWIDRFEKWGGVPKSVLKKTTAHYQSYLDYNISSLNLDSCLASIGALIFDSEQVCGTVLHTTVTKDGEYCDFQILFASLYVEKAVMRYYQQGMQQQVIKFLDNSRDYVFGSMRGCIFEILAHPMLARGGRFNAYHLGNPNKGVVQIELPKTELYAFKSIDEVKAGYYYRSSSKNFESIDALYISDRAEGDHNKIFQTTVGKEHPIKVNGLEKILSKLRSSTSASTSTKIRLYFVVPKDIFPAFTAVQTYITKKEEPHKCVPPEICDNVEQWALELDYSSFSSTE